MTDELGFVFQGKTVDARERGSGQPRPSVMEAVQDSAAKVSAIMSKPR